MTTSTIKVLVAATVLASVMCAPPCFAEAPKAVSPPVLKLEGTNVDLTYTTLAPGAQVFKLSIKEWTTDAEMQALKAIIDKGGQRKLRNTLNKGNAKGQINLASQDALDISIARRIPQKDGGSILLLVLMERVGPFNRRDQDHIFGAVQIKLDAKGEGEGVVIGQAKLIMREDGVMLFEKIGKETNRLIGIKTVAQ